MPVILQAESAECGMACLAMVSAFYGKVYDLSSLRMRMSTSLRGITLSRLMQMAGDLDFSVRALRLDLSEMRRLKTPCILHWNLDHFVVLERVEANSVVIIDPGVGRLKLSRAQVSNSFSGIALELSPNSSFQKETVRHSLTFRDLLKSAHGLPGGLARLFAISLGIQALLLLGPFYAQTVIDDVIGTGDTDLLTLLGLGFGTITLLNVAISGVRSFGILSLGAGLQFGWATKLFHHLVRLPLHYFERRSVSDVLSRFQSISSIQSLASNTIVEALMDGIMTLTTICVMLYYSSELAAISVVALALYGLSRLAFAPAHKERTHEALVASAQEDGHFLETIRAVMAIKSYAKENVREQAWQNKSAAAIRQKLRVSALATIEGLCNQSLFGLEGIVVLWVGALLVMDGHMTIGMLVAFVSYKGLFSSRASALVDKIMEFRFASVHLERISDIAMEEKEFSSNEDRRESFAFLQGILKISDVNFRYSPNDGFVIRDLSFSVAQGEFFAIRAPSGTGKTTLLKILMGLLRPESGKILVDGMDIKTWPCSYRRSIASVMQDDALLTGSLADNITFFDQQPDLKRMEECARAAAIYDDICRMPMGFFSLVGDMGAALSGGQKQRVLLARALYSQPRILFLDEATSHLDPETEQVIHRNLQDMKITRVVVAHRSETLKIADRILDLGVPRKSSSQHPNKQFTLSATHEGELVES